MLPNRPGTLERESHIPNRSVARLQPQEREPESLERGYGLGESVSGVALGAERLGPGFQPLEYARHVGRLTALGLGKRIVCRQCRALEHQLGALDRCRRRPPGRFEAIARDPEKCSAEPPGPHLVPERIEP